MTCSACSAHVEKAVNKLDGVNKVSVSLLTNSMTVDFDGKTTSVQAIIAAVESPVTEQASRETKLIKKQSPLSKNPQSLLQGCLYQ